MLCVAPKSTCSHCGSLKALDQRVVRLPSTARFAVVPPFSTDEAVAVLLSATFVVPQAAAAGLTMLATERLAIEIKITAGIMIVLSMMDKLVEAKIRFFIIFLDLLIYKRQPT